MGKSFFNDYLRDLFPEVLFYPEFFDAKKLLVKQDYRGYFNLVWKHRNEIKMALYPDYCYWEMPLPTNIVYIFPVHELSSQVLMLMKKLREDGYEIWAGYASSPRYRNYSINSFLKFSEGYKRWYLGVSSKSELYEAVQLKFDGIDVTTMLFGRFNQVKQRDYVVRKMRELQEYVSANQFRRGLQLSF